MPVSFSQLSTYQRCPKQYEFACVKKLPRSLSRGESFGSSIHNTLKRWGELELAYSPLPVDPKKQLQLFIDDEPKKQSLPLDRTTLQTLLRENFIAEGYPSRADMDSALKAGQKLLDHFYVWWKNTQRTILGIEKSFKLTINDISNKHPIILSGRFDRVERSENGIIIYDYKTSTPRSQEDIDTDLQLSIYALASKTIWNEPIERLTLLFLSENGIEEVSTTRSEEQLQDATSVISTTVTNIENKHFSATPSVRTCGHCPYKNICPSKITIRTASSF